MISYTAQADKLYLTLNKCRPRKEALRNTTEIPQCLHIHFQENYNSNMPSVL